MSATPEISLAAPPQASRTSHRRSILVGVGISSLAALLLELALTRLFSVVLFYHFAFLAISIALLGLGSGGVFAHLFRRWLARFATRNLLASLACVNALTIPIALEIVLHVPVSLELSKANFLRLTAIYMASAVPFFVTGLEFSILFAREAEHIAHLYAADLAGGALACLSIVPLLNLLGAPNAILVAAAMAATAASVWSNSSFLRKSALIEVALLVATVTANHSGRFVDVVYAKGLLRNKSWVEFARWNAISRVEVDRQGGGKAIVIDADASTYIMNADLRHWKDTEWEKDLMSAPPALANVLRPRGTYAIIGPGGGVDVLRAVANGSPSVTGIEINPIIANRIMRDRYADYAYHLYERPEVHIAVTDGRSFIRNAHQTFDVVQMTLVDTWASTAAGAFALSENSLYTTEAFRAYFDHLNPNGILAITRWEFRQPREALRVVSVAMQALHECGVANPAQNFIIASLGELSEDGIPVVVLAKKTGFTADEEQTVLRHIATYPQLHPLYVPSAPQPNPFSELITSNDPYGFAQHYAYNVAPVHDNAPFFFFTLKLGQVLQQGSLVRAIDWKVNLGLLVLGMVLLISIAAVLAFLIVPLAFARAQNRPPVVPLFFFVAVGLAYILVEVAFIQRFVLFLGHPTYALTVVVFLMLLSSGAGSLVSRSLLAETSSVWVPLVLVASVLAIYVFILPPMLNALIGLPFAAKLLTSAGLLVPLGFAMGMPFPTGLRALAQLAPHSSQATAQESIIEWAWAMNAASSVLGSLLAMVIAIEFGLNVTLACGAGVYLLAILFSPTLQPHLRGYES